jgi:hypothetical protein
VCLHAEGGHFENLLWWGTLNGKVCFTRSKMYEEVMWRRKEVNKFTISCFLNRKLWMWWKMKQRHVNKCTYLFHFLQIVLNVITRKR